MRNNPIERFGALAPMHSFNDKQNYLMVFSAAETVCSMVIEVVTEPRPPGTGVMASTTGSTDS